MPIEQTLLDKKRNNELNSEELLDLRNQKLKAPDLPILITTLAQKPIIMTLNLGFNQIGDEGAQILAQNTTLVTLFLYNNQISDKGAQALAEKTTLTNLHLGNNQIGPDGAKALARNITLRSLNLRNNYIGDEGARALAQNTTLTTLNIENNKIWSEGAKALAKNNYLATLNIMDNNIGDKGAQVLAKNSTLRSLNLNNNGITDRGAKALTQNLTLIDLEILNNHIESNLLRQKLLKVPETNKQALMERRRQWLYKLLLLATAETQPHQDNTFAWAELPNDLKIQILKLGEWKEASSIGKTNNQIQKAIEFVFNRQQLQVIKEGWQEKRSIKLIEIDTPKGLNFHFKTKPLSLKNQDKPVKKKVKIN